jgi:GNAT superfamily N-acetyltransferase
MVDIIRAVPDQAQTLQALARASKQHWGYSSAYMQAWTHDKTLTADFIARHPVFYAADGAAVAGFYALEWNTPDCELKHLWINPNYIGQGIGKRLFTHLIAQLRTLGVQTCKIVAEPHAEGFYLRMGAIRIGEQPRPLLGQMLPVLQLTVSPAANLPQINS